MNYRLMVWILFMTAILLQGCIRPPIPGHGGTTTTAQIVNKTIVNKTEIPKVTRTLQEKIISVEIPEVVSHALSNYDYYAYNNPTIKSHAEEITKGCEDDECRLFRIHKYVIKNFYYREYENRSHGIRGIFNTRYGVCSDFAVFYYNYLKSLGMEVYVAFIPEHTYALSCNHNLTRLQWYIENDPDFRDFTQEHVFPNFEFEVNHAFNKSCLRIEGPSATKGAYRYPGEHYEDTRIAENESFFLNPETWAWEPFNESRVTVEKPRAHIERHLRFIMSEKSEISWKVKRIKKMVDGGLDYEFEIKDVTLEAKHQYADFTLPEVSRFDRLRIHITVQAANPILFYTLQDGNQLENFKYYVEHRYALTEDDLRRFDEKPRTGPHPYEFDYISSCSQVESTTFFDKECLIPDAGRRVFAIHNEGFFKTNEINITLRYLEFL
ncbi:MAG TPA: transglutaminase domain-containing protein [Candidatus Altiarchaeales archaeon]|nr:transglutaminase domain-containing protein [Candidatus Altiarchaeales archaeon]